MTKENLEERIDRVFRCIRAYHCSVKAYPTIIKIFQYTGMRIPHITQAIAHLRDRGILTTDWRGKINHIVYTIKDDSRKKDLETFAKIHREESTAREENLQGPEGEA